MPCGVAVVGVNLRVEWVNDRMRTLLGCDGDPCGRLVADAFPIPGLPDRVSDVLASGAVQRDVMLERVSGPRRDYVRCTLSVLGEGESRRVLIKADPVTQLERYRIANQVRHFTTPSATQVANLVDGLQAILWEAEVPVATRPRDGDTPWRLTFVSQRAEEILGYPLFQWFTEESFWANHIHQQDREMVLATYRRVLVGRKGRDVEYRMQAADGSWVWVVDRVQALVDKQGRTTGLRGMMLDTTERRRAEERLQRTEARHRLFFENAPFGIFRANREGRFRSANPALADMLGYAEATDLRPVHLGDDVFRDTAALERLLDVADRSGVLEGVEVNWYARDGRLLRVRLSGRVVHRPGEGPSEYELIAEDVTEKRQLEERLRQAQKMEAIGQLAGGVAHDFNNILTVINGYASLVARGGRGPDQVQQALEGILDAGERAAALTRQLLAFSRKQVLEPRVLPLRDLVAGMSGLLRRLLGARVEVEAELAPDTGLVRADPSQLEQVVMNLAVNARDAMPGGGTLTLRTGNVEVEAEHARRIGAQEGAYVVLEVRDTGTGMDEATLSRIFEPFFTTKPKGKGTGLGLATVYGVVRQSGGHLDVQSRPGEGTTFTVLLPRAARGADAPAARPAGATDGPATGTVMVVEDDEAVRRFTCTALEGAGYAVLAAESAEDALKLWVGDGPRPDLLLADVELPGLTGIDLAAEMQRTCPELPVVFMVGNAASAPAAGARVLKKPFADRGLLDAVAAALAACLPAS